MKREMRVFIEPKLRDSEVSFAKLIKEIDELRTVAQDLTDRIIAIQEEIKKGI